MRIGQKVIVNPGVSQVRGTFVGTGTFFQEVGGYIADAMLIKLDPEDRGWLKKSNGDNKSYVSIIVAHSDNVKSLE